MPTSTAKPAPSARSISDRLLLAILVALSVIVYMNTLGHDFVLDDFPIFKKHSSVAKGLAGIPEIFRTPYWYGYTPQPNGLYRPLPLAIFAALRGLFGVQPLPGHLLNIVLFALCVALLYRFIIQLAGKEHRITAFAAALLFAVHPVHTEVVANIKSCDELLCFAFAMGALQCLLRYLDGGRAQLLAVAAGLYFMSLLSKETSIFLVGLVPVMAFAFVRPKIRRSVSGTIAFAAVAALFLTIRWMVLHQYEPTAFRPGITENALAAVSGADRLANALMLLGNYLKLLFFPAPLLFDYSYNTLPLVRWNAVSPWISLLIHLGLLGYAGVRIAKARRDLPALGILFYLGGIALFSNAFILIGATFAERFLFLPSAGFCIAVAFLVAALYRKLQAQNPQGGKALVAGAGLLVVVFAGMSISRNADWADEETLYLTDLQKAPRNFRIPYYLATRTVLNSTTITNPETERAYLREAIPLLHRSIGIYDRFAPALAQLGSVYMKTGSLDSGRYFNEHALALNPADTFTRNNIAAYHFQTGDYGEAIRLSRVNLEIDPLSRQAYANIGACYLKMNHADSAIRPLQQAWAIEPGNARTAYFLSVAFSMNGQPDSARKYEGR